MIVYSYFNYGQIREADSLENLLKLAKDDVSRINTLNDLAKIYALSDANKAFNYANTALKLAEENKSELLKAKSLHNIGFSYYGMSDHGNAVKFYFKSLKISETIRDTIGIILNYNNLSYIYQYQKNNQKALEYALKAMQYFNEKKGDEWHLSGSCVALGLAQYAMKEYNEALKSFKKALEIRRKVKNNRPIAYAYNLIGISYYGLNEFSTSMIYQDSALKIFQKSGEKNGQMECVKELGKLYFKLGENKRAIKFFIKGIELAKVVKSPMDEQFIYESLVEVYEREKKYPNAFYALKILKTLKDSLSSEAKVSELESKYHKEKEIAVLEKQNELDLIKKDAIVKQQKIINYSVIGALILVLMIAFFIYRGYYQKQKANRELDIKNKKIENAYRLLGEKNKEVLDSIHYARRIQRSLITNEKYIEKTLKRLSRDV